MNLIYKYVFEDLNRPVIAPAGKVIRADPNPANLGQVAFWMLISDADFDAQATRYSIVATGETFPDSLEYQATAVMPSGFVWHVVRPIEPAKEDT